MFSCLLFTFTLCHLAHYVHCQRWSSRGHNLKSFALASKPASPRRCHVLGSTTALLLTFLTKMGQGHDKFCFVGKNARELAKKFFRHFFPGKRLNFSGNLRNFKAKIFFFVLLCRTLEISGKFANFWRENLFFLEITSALCLWSLASSIPLLGLKRICFWPWLRIFLCPWHWSRALCP